MEQELNLEQNEAILKEIHKLCRKIGFEDHIFMAQWAKEEEERLSEKCSALWQKELSLKEEIKKLSAIVDMANISAAHCPRCNIVDPTVLVDNKRAVWTSMCCKQQGVVAGSYMFPIELVDIIKEVESSVAQLKGGLQSIPLGAMPLRIKQ